VVRSLHQLDYVQWSAGLYSDARTRLTQREVARAGARGQGSGGFRHPGLSNKSQLTRRTVWVPLTACLCENPRIVYTQAATSFSQVNKAAHPGLSNTSLWSILSL